MKPFAAEAARLRQERATQDPDFSLRVDERLNKGRINFLLFGYGETHEPPHTERAFIGSYTIVSYDQVADKLDMVSFTHDIRSPEVERYRRAQGQEQATAVKIDQAYRTGGFPLMRLLMENATGLAVDFQLAFEDAVLANATDQVFEGITVNVPAAFSVNPFYLDGKKYPAGQFNQGVQVLSGTAVLQFIKTVPIETTYDKSLEHNARKHLVVKGLMERLKARSTDITFWWRALQFVNGELNSRAIAYDFDVKPLLVHNIGEIISLVGRSVLGGHSASASSVPRVDRTVYIVDPASGDGGVQWVDANAHTNPATRRDIEAGIYPDRAVEVPYRGDANAENLVTGYWEDVRKVIRERFVDGLAPLPPCGVRARFGAC